MPRRNARLNPLIAIACGALAACSEPPKPPPAKPAASPAATATSAARALTPAWPPAQAKEGKQAPDLFAKNYYVVFDASGSMASKECSPGRPRIDTARDALSAFAGSIPKNANLGLLVFNTQGVREWVPLGASRETFTSAVGKVFAGGGTPLLSAIRQAYNTLQAQAARQLGYGEYHLVVVTDGEASAGEDPTSIVNTVLTRSPVVLHTIGFCIGSKHSLNQPGRVLYRAADNPEQLSAGLAEVLAEAPAFSDQKFTK